jgi:tetratricopeptide (TPR) repeat protein
LERCLKQTKQDIYYKTLGDAYFSIGMCDKAILSYENALKLNNLMEETYFNLGVCLYLQGQFY